MLNRLTRLPLTALLAITALTATACQIASAQDNGPEIVRYENARIWTGDGFTPGAITVRESQIGGYSPAHKKRPRAGRGRL